MRGRVVIDFANGGRGGRGGASGMGGRFFRMIAVLLASVRFGMLRPLGRCPIQVLAKMTPTALTAARLESSPPILVPSPTTNSVTSGQWPQLRSFEGTTGHTLKARSYPFLVQRFCWRWRSDQLRARPQLRR